MRFIIYVKELMTIADFKKMLSSNIPRDIFAEEIMHHEFYMNVALEHEYEFRENIMEKYPDLGIVIEF